MFGNLNDRKRLYPVIVKTHNDQKSLFSVIVKTCNDRKNLC